MNDHLLLFLMPYFVWVSHRLHTMAGQLRVEEQAVFVRFEDCKICIAASFNLPHLTESARTWQ